MNLQITYSDAGFVRAYDVNMGLYYFVQNAAFSVLDTSSIGASTRLAAASEFIVHHSGEIKKLPMKVEVLVGEYMTLRAGQSTKVIVPIDVRNAVDALYAAIASYK